MLENAFEPSQEYASMHIMTGFSYDYFNQAWQSNSVSCAQCLISLVVYAHTQCMPLIQTLSYFGLSVSWKTLKKCSRNQALAATNVDWKSCIGALDFISASVDNLDLKQKGNCPGNRQFVIACLSVA